jgi:hypothetical protein
MRREENEKKGEKGERVSLLSLEPCCLKCITLVFKEKPKSEVINKIKEVPNSGQHPCWWVLYFYEKHLMPVLKNELEFAHFGTLLPKVHYTFLLKKQTRNNGY